MKLVVLLSLFLINCGEYREFEEATGELELTKVGQKDGCNIYANDYLWIGTGAKKYVLEPQLITICPTDCSDEETK